MKYERCIQTFVKKKEKKEKKKLAIIRRLNRRLTYVDDLLEKKRVLKIRVNYVRTTLYKLG
jgi:hypothetical protein